MAIPFSITAISGAYPGMAENKNENFLYLFIHLNDRLGGLALTRE
jgi:hypothetical protein